MFHLLNQIFTIIQHFFQFVYTFFKNYDKIFLFSLKNKNSATSKNDMKTKYKKKRRFRKWNLTKTLE